MSYTGYMGYGWGTMRGSHPRGPESGSRTWAMLKHGAHRATGGEDSCRKATAAVRAASLVPDAKRYKGLDARFNLNRLSRLTSDCLGRRKNCGGAARTPSEQRQSTAALQDAGAPAQVTGPRRQPRNSTKKLIGHHLPFCPGQGPEVTPHTIIHDAH